MLKIIEDPQLQNHNSIDPTLTTPLYLLHVPQHRSSSYHNISRGTDKSCREYM